MIGNKRMNTGINEINSYIQGLRFPCKSGHFRAERRGKG
jgi:hypothetical protein